MLSDKPKLVFSDIGGRVTLEARLPDSLLREQAQKQTPEQQYLKALYTTGEALL